MHSALKRVCIPRASDDREKRRLPNAIQIHTMITKRQQVRIQQRLHTRSRNRSICVFATAQRGTIGSWATVQNRIQARSLAPFIGLFVVALALLGVEHPRT